MDQYFNWHHIYDFNRFSVNVLSCLNLVKTSGNLLVKVLLCSKGLW